MLSPTLVIVASLAYLGLLFMIAFLVDRRARSGRGIIRSPIVYTFSLAVYCTSWTFYGAVGTAARTGYDYLTIYLGPTIVFVAWWFGLRKIIRISKTQRITSIADFIASRYGKSTQLGVIVSVMAVLGIMPYVALQLKAVATSFAVLSSHSVLASSSAGALRDLPLAADTGFWVALGMAAFAILFGTRYIDADEHHEGVVAAIAFESLVKLFALLAVGIFVSVFLDPGLVGQFRTAYESPELRHLFALRPDYAPSWLASMLLSMSAIICLPRQFHITVVENVDERHLSTAAWLFPLYLLLMCLFVVPIAVAGVTGLPAGADPDFYVLTVPLVHGQDLLALFAFIGGLSSATSMVIVSAIALSTLVCNDLVMPLLLRVRWLRLAERQDLPRLLLTIRRASVLSLMLLGYAYYRLIGEGGPLAAIGLVAFTAVAQFLPAIVGGMAWKGGTRAGAQAGLVLGSAVWAYTLVLPAVVQSDWLDAAIVEHGPFGIALLRPDALFGLGSWGPIPHALFWSLGLNVAGYVLVSLFTQQDALERIQATLFVDVFNRPTGTPQAWRGRAELEDLYALLRRFVGDARARKELEEYAARQGRGVQDLREADADLIAFVERLLAGSIGAASARVMVASVAKGEMLTIDEVMKILEETHQAIEYSQRLEQKSRELEATAAQLKAANERLKELDHLKDEFLAMVSHELRTPLTSIRSFSEILVEEDGLSGEQARRFLSVISSESRRLTRLLDTILDLARLEQGRVDWNMREVDVASTLEEAVAATDGIYRDAGVTLEISIARGGSTLMADRDRLIQVFVNLLSNAAKFCDRERGHVWVRGEARSAGYLVSITDNGRGISPKYQSLIFEKFSKLGDDHDAASSGSGLGLAISRQIVEHHGGQIWVRSSPGEGATFCVFLPRPGAEAAGLEIAGAAGHAALP